MSKIRKILVIESNSKMEGIYFLNIQIYLNLLPTMKKMADFAYKVLDENDDIDIIVTREKVGEENTALDIIEYLNASKRDIPIIVIGSVDDKNLENRVQYIKSGVELKPLLHTIASVLKITSDQMVNVLVPKFYPIPINYFLSLSSTNCTLYSIDFDDSGKETYIPVFESFSDIAAPDIKGLISNGATDLFVKDIDRLKFINHLTTETISKISHRELTEGDRVIAGKAALEFLSSKVSEVGITPNTITMAKQCTKNMMMNAKDEPRLKNLLKSLIKNKAGYLYQHTQILTYVSMHIVGNMGWTNVASQEEKLAFVCLFHDIALKQDEHAQVHTKEELTSSKFGKKEKQLIDAHASIAANLVKKHPKCPEDAEMIIRQHHGHLQGTEIPDSYDYNISPLTALFMVAEAYTEKLLEVPDDENPNKAFIIAGLKKSFSSKKHSKIVKTLEKIML